MEEADLVFDPEGCIPVHQVSTRSKVLLVSFDGFRWNYDQDVDTPNLDTMAVEGVKARYMTPAFITITSPCHFTLLTGRYLENHGVIHNMWFNTSTGLRLPYYSTQGVDSWWDNGSLPIWITAQRQGLKTGSVYFPGGRAKYQGEEVNMKLVEPALFSYSNETNWRENIDIVMQWFTVNNLDFIALYFGEPDSAGHKYGPESTQRKNMVKQVDRTIGYLRQRIRESGLESNLNLIITSDHGMETVIKTNEIHIGAIENFTFTDIQFELLDYGPNGLLVPKEGKLEHVYSVLKNAHPNLHVYKKEDFPRRFHYANHSRITPLLLYGDPGYVIHGRYKLQFNTGEHGFDNEAMNMKTIFRAVGPAFRQGLLVEPFESVNVYALLCELLGITPEPHDGSLRAVSHMLRESAGTGSARGDHGHRDALGFPREQRHLVASLLPSRVTGKVSRPPRTTARRRDRDSAQRDTGTMPTRAAAGLQANPTPLLWAPQVPALLCLLPGTCRWCWERLLSWDAGQEHTNPTTASESQAALPAACGEMRKDRRTWLTNTTSPGLRELHTEFPKPPQIPDLRSSRMTESRGEMPPLSFGTEPHSPAGNIPLPRELRLAIRCILERLFALGGGEKRKH
ncbi:ectonucleotide pyrophosphatase/phosphodiesterase family member 7 [Podargus strigoides]